MESKKNFYETLGEDIVMPDDPNLRKRLELKLEEYKKIIPEHVSEENIQGEDLGSMASKDVSSTQKDVHFKIKVLGKLLKDGHVGVEDFEREIVEDEDMVLLKNAFGVIKSYVEAGGEQIVGGRGLPE